MAVPLTFKPAPVDPSQEFQRRLADAPREHAEALLALLETVQAAYDHGIIDTVHGALSARDTIINKAAELARTPEAEHAIRNALEAARLLASIDPAILEHLSRAVAPALAEAGKEQAKEKTPPSLFTILRRTLSADGRRGLSFATNVLTALGRSLK